MSTELSSNLSAAAIVRSRRRPKPSQKVLDAAAQDVPMVKRGRGRPRKVAPEQQGSNVDSCVDKAKHAVQAVRIHCEDRTGTDRDGQQERRRMEYFDPELKDAVVTMDSERETDDKSIVPPRKRNHFPQPPLPLDPHNPTPEKTFLPSPGGGPADASTFDEEFSEDVLAQILVDGITNSTIPLSDSDLEEIEDDDDKLSLVSSNLSRGKNTRRTPKRPEIEEIKVKVHDGLAERIVTISSLDKHVDVLEKAAQAMKRPNHLVEIGYEAPWSSKIGTKKSLTYLSNPDELTEFWCAYRRYVKDQRSKRRNRDQEITCEIVFRNMLDTLQGATKTTVRAADALRGRPLKQTDPTYSARDSADEKITQATKSIQAAMFCPVHNRVCYKKYNGTCGVYTPDLILEHAQKLARRELHVVASKVPESMSAKLLDYKRPGRMNQGAPPTNDGVHKIQVDSHAAPVRVAQEVLTSTTHKGPLNYPAIGDWLKACEDDLERGRDNHEYRKLAPVFSNNGCTRIDDIARMNTDRIEALAKAEGVDVTIGLVNRVHDYAVEDVACVKRDGKLSTY
ncbi:hypothetical protein ACEPAG_9375 [Sanghuangporus baumii]